MAARQKSKKTRLKTARRTTSTNQVFVVTMSLYPSRGEAEAYAGIDERFTPEIAREWSCLVFSASIGRPGLAVALNKVIFDTFGQTMSRAADIGASVYSAVGPIVEDTPWTPGGGGAHELRATVQGNLNATGAPTLSDWNFRILPGPGLPKQVFVNVLVSFVEVDIQS